MDTEFSSEQIKEYTNKVLEELRKVHYKELGWYSDRMMLIKLITMRSTVGLKSDGYGRSLVKNSDLEVYVWNYYWMLHKASLEELALVYGRLMQFDVPVLEQFHSYGDVISAEDRDQVKVYLEVIKEHVQGIQDKPDLIANALHAAKRLCLQVKFHAPEWWITERNKLNWVDENGDYTFDLDLTAF